MKLSALLFFFILSINLFSQKLSEVKQITNVDGDARNINFDAMNYFYNPPIFFEVHKDGYSNIYSLTYDRNMGEFSDLNIITNDTAQNINPVCVRNYLIYQTNKKGNWDIAYKIFNDSEWTETKYLAESVDAETQPVSFYYGPFVFDDSLRIMYSRKHSIYISTYNDSGFNNKIIFEGSDSVIYSQPTGEAYFQNFINTPPSGTYIIAKKTELSNNSSQIVYKYKNESQNWGNENVIIDGAHCDNPKLISPDWGSTLLSFENEVGNYKNIFLMNDWVNSKEFFAFKDTLIGKLTDLNTSLISVITKRTPLLKSNELNLLYSHTFKYLINDSLFISISKYLHINYYSGYKDTLIYTKVKNSSLALVGLDYGYTCYSIWEDSVDGNIQLFGSLSYNDFTGVNESNYPNKFTLFQNYPNPFNPNTTIRFYNPHSAYLKLNIYNVLGEEVKKLMDGYTNSGLHEIKFNGADLPSGIYFYQIESENFKQIKKMILLK